VRRAPVADEGAVYMPYWMMQNLLLTEGDIVTLRSAALPKGRFVKLRPHSKEFLDISNPRAVLEMTLRSFSCLTVGDTVPIHYNGRVHAIDVLEARPGDAISVIETDCEVDFAPPLDYVEPDWKAEAAAAALAQAAAAAAAAGAAGVAGASGSGGGGAGGGGAAAAAEAAPPAEPAFLAFAGAAQRLDGKAVGEARPVPVAAAPPGGARLPAPAPPPAAADAAAAAAGRRAGKLMFKDRLAAKFADGGAAGRPGAPAAPPPPPAEEKKAEAPAFKAFTGKGNSLK
jgi:ubiquitin fusion degradation protein 1